MADGCLFSNSHVSPAFFAKCLEPFTLYQSYLQNSDNSGDNFLTKEVKDKKSAEYLVSAKWFYRKQQSLLTFFFLLSFSLSAHQSDFTLVNRDITIVFKQVTESTIT